MKESILLNNISKIKEIPLPGAKAHLSMAPYHRFKYIKNYDSFKSKATIASVLIFVFENDKNESCFTLIKRTSGIGVHSGQISLPGGKKELTDNSNWDTAIRESEEEIGIKRKKINFVCELSPIYIPPSNYFVYPFIGIYSESPKFKSDPLEVDRLITVPVKSLIDKSLLVNKKINTTYAKDVRFPAFKFNNEVVWGATAMILAEFKFLLNRIDI